MIEILVILFINKIYSLMTLKLKPALKHMGIILTEGIQCNTHRLGCNSSCYWLLLSWAVS